MARPDGVVIVSGRYWAFAGRNGSLREGVMPAPRAAVRRVPLLRGLARLATAVSPLLRGGGVARRRERWLLLLALVAPLFAFLLPPVARTPVAIAVALGVVAWLLRGRTLALHGAEHRAIAAAEARQLQATWDGDARPSRFSPRCGTNFGALALPVTAGINWLWPLSTAVFTPLAVSAVSLALTMELWQLVERSRGGPLRLLLAPGLALQRLTTREPDLEETRTALRAVDSVLRREFGA